RIWGRVHTLALEAAKHCAMNVRRIKWKSGGWGALRSSSSSSAHPGGQLTVHHDQLLAESCHRRVGKIASARTRECFWSRRQYQFCKTKPKGDFKRFKFCFTTSSSIRRNPTWELTGFGPWCIEGTNFA